MKNYGRNAHLVARVTLKTAGRISQAIVITLARGFLGSTNGLL
jgi:hypothetical protein